MAATTTPAAAFEALMRGVTHWDVPKDPVPCELLLIGEAAFPVMVNGKGQVIIAASTYGRGRLVVVAHEGYLVAASLSPFLRNAVDWLCPTPGAPVGVHPSLEALNGILQGAGTQAQLESEQGAALGVYCIDAYSDGLSEELVQFVKRGGGLLIGGQAWYWASQHGAHQVLSAFPGNQVTCVAGVYFTDTYGDTGRFKVSKNIPKIPLHVRCGEDTRQDQQQLLKGVSELDIKTGGLPSRLLVHGALAFPLGMDPSLGCFLAGARYGKGRVVLAAHESLLSAPTLGTFLLNAVHWLAGGPTGRVGVNPNLKGLCALLDGSGLQCSLESQLTDQLQVYCCGAYSDAEAGPLREFVAEGGGLLMGGQAWWWASQNPGRPALAGFPGNRLLNGLGLSITARTLQPDCFPAATPEMLGYHFRQALAAFLQQVKQGRGCVDQKRLAKLGNDATAFLSIPARGIPAYASVHRLLLKTLRLAGLPAVSKKNPVAAGSLEAAMLSLATELARSGTDCTQLAAGLGGCACANPAERTITVQVDACNPGPGECWMSTGRYLLNGKNAEFSLPDSASSAGLKVLIGCHTDDLSNARQLARAPVVTHQCCVDQATESVSCLWGGLVYVIVPKGSQLGPVSLTITGSVPAPYYRLGKTSLEEWQHSVQHSPAPWGELATDNIILTVPTTDLRTLEDPEPLLHLWDEMMLAIAKLAAQPFPFPRPERIVADVQISAGWMHSGYPIMCHVESVQDLLNSTGIRSQGLWGPIHELGHNQQRPGWEFPPHTTEATCNLWSVYVHETVLGIPRAQAHPALSATEREKRIREHLGKGAPLEDWSVWTALETYLQLQEAFGWEPFTELFAEYQTLSGLPNTNTGRMNLWVKKFSEKVQKNLVPFFETWGWPMQPDVAKSLAHLPPWQDHPMRTYVCAEE
ncbi:TRPM8 channel-associated factor 2-like [Sorex fumeus]|uniref:TRPM8 channel-associated factor 2-like n=1 Tax=Sorex fumeus TaxID=62283 RepID=UPI0024ADE4B9|nr:TRPM8 channel-associated factor 2-like [Sorex fumeus]